MFNQLYKTRITNVLKYAKFEFYSELKNKFAGKFKLS